MIMTSCWIRFIVSKGPHLLNRKCFTYLPDNTAFRIVHCRKNHQRALSANKQDVGNALTVMNLVKNDILNVSDQISPKSKRRKTNNESETGGYVATYPRYNMLRRISVVMMRQVASSTFTCRSPVTSPMLPAPNFWPKSRNFWLERALMGLV